jgi:hypothetical protein
MNRPNVEQFSTILLRSQRRVIEISVRYYYTAHDMVTVFT